MAINKNFPNYKKAIMTVRVLSRYTVGPNHNQRRVMKGQEKGALRYAKNFRLEQQYDKQKKEKLANIEKRHEANRKRSAQRRAEAKLKKQHA